MLRDQPPLFRPDDPAGIKPKDLIGIPWMLAFALRADGWYLRQDIIWAKPNPMPESVTDRCTKAHEHLFLLTKSARYFWDAEAIREPAICGANGSQFQTGKTGEHQLGRAQKVRPSAPKGSFNGKTEAMAGTGQNAFRAITETRNRRSVWSIASQPYDGAHFAVMPKKLVEPCILAGCPEQCCPVCGQGWERVVEKQPGRCDRPNHPYNPSRPDGMTLRGGRLIPGEVTTIGARPSCKCGTSNSIPGAVLDPFNGAATVGIVALEHGRQYLGIELNPEYVRLSVGRLTDATHQGNLFKAPTSPDKPSLPAQQLSSPGNPPPLAQQLPLLGES